MSPSAGDDHDVHFLLGRLEGKVDALISQTSNLNRAFRGHETRIRELEKSKSWVLGLSAACSCGIALIFNLLT